MGFVAQIYRRWRNKEGKKLFQSLNCFTSISYIIKFSKKKKSVEVLIQGLPQLTHTYIKKIIIFF